MPFVLAVLLLFLPVTGFGAAIALHDARGVRVELAQPARRIVALAPHLSENLYAIGAGRQLIAHVEGADFPDAARQLQRIGSAQQIDLQSLAALQPDLILASINDNREDQLAKLAAHNIPLYTSEIISLDDIAPLLKSLGQLSGQTAAANAVAGRFQAGLRKLRNRHAAKAPVSVYFEAWQDPAGTRKSLHLVQQVLASCGAQSVFDQRSIPDLATRFDVVRQRAPDLILGSGPEHQQQAFVSAWSNLRSVPAVAQGHVYLLHPAFLSRPTPRLLLGAQDLCQQFEIIRQERAS